MRRQGWQTPLFTSNPLFCGITSIIKSSGNYAERLGQVMDEDWKPLARALHRGGTGKMVAVWMGFRNSNLLQQLLKPTVLFPPLTMESHLSRDPEAAPNHGE